MAQGFDSSKATNDLKQLLNLDALKSCGDSQAALVSSNSADIDIPPVGSKKRVRRKAKNAKDNKEENKNDGNETPENINTVTNLTSNSNGNALLTESHTPVQTETPRNQSSASVLNSNDTKPPAKTRKKKKTEKKQLNTSENANSHQTSGDLIPCTQDKNTTVNTNIETDSSHVSSTSQHRENTDLSKSNSKNVTLKEKKVNVTASEKVTGNKMEKMIAVNSSNAAKPRLTKLGDEEVTPEFLSRLEPHKIHVLKKKNQRFPKANFFCRLCDYHLDRKEDCEKHIQENRHCRRKEVNEMDALLQRFPSPTPKQLDAISDSLDKVDLEHGISVDEQNQRIKIVQRLEKTLQEQIPDVILYMYGSSLTRMGLTTGDINVNLNSTDKDKKLTFLLKEIHQVMKDRTDTGFSNVHSDFSATVPALLLTDIETGFKVTVTILCYFAHCSSELMAIYSGVDDRARQLCVAFRYWANICGLDRQADGFIPPVALNIMVVFFLQCVEPAVVPVLVPPKVTGDERIDFKDEMPSFQKLKSKVTKSMGKNTMSIGELWLGLLRFYSIKFDTANVVVCIRSSTDIQRSSKPWNSKKLAVEDPFMLKNNITRMVNNSRIYDFWQDCIRKAYHYFGLPRNEAGKALIKDMELESVSEIQQVTSVPSDKSETKGKDTDSSKSELQEKANALSKETASCSQNRVVVPSHPLINVSNPSSNSSGSRSSTPSIPDDVLPKRNSIARSPSVNEKPASESFETPLADSNDEKNTDKLSSVTDSQDLVGATISGEHPSSAMNIETFDTAELSGENVACPIINGVKELNLSSSVACSEQSNHSSDISSKINSQEHCEPLLSDTETSDTKPCNIDNSVSSRLADNDSNSPVCGEKKNSLTGSSEIAQNNCFYDFTEDVFTDGKGPTLVCTSCEKEGHLKNSCPEDELPPVLPLPPMTKFHHKVLEDTIKKVPYEVGLTNDSFKQRQYFIICLEKFIQFRYADAQLCLFGSSCNGFGFEGSDMDICMTFARKKPYLDKVLMIEKLAHFLRQFDQLKFVQAISTAKVPIVKFTAKGLELEGDISLYNTLAQENTRLLLCYNQIDARVKTLGYTIKTFAKVCDIGDASRGSLSSYAYILMMLYYLQQVKPAVIPVLQELYQGDKKPVQMVEDCNAWFMGKLDILPTLWPEMGKNEMSVAELWLGFLRFYVEEFNYKEFVVCIRQKDPLTRFDKLWNGSSIAIEDPFDLSHNLGSGLTRTMNNFIFKTFINGRMLYGSPIDDNMDMFNKYQNASDYFFDTELLSESRPPNVRGCRRCGKIGHMVRHCPHNKKDKDDDHKKQQPKHKEQQQSQQQSQQQQYRQSPKQYRNQSQQRQMQMEKDWRDRDYRQNPPNNNNNAMRIPPHSNSAQPFNAHLNSHPGLVPSMPRGVVKSHNQHDQHHRMQSHPMQQMPNRFPAPQGPSPGSSSKPSLLSSTPRQMMPGNYYGSYNTDPVPGRPTFRMGHPPADFNFHRQSSNSAPPPNFTGLPFTMRPTLNPVVQSLFASTQGQVMGVGSMASQDKQRKRKGNGT